MNTIRVLVVADASDTRESLIKALQSEPDISLVGIANSPAQVLRAIRDTQPHIVLMDEQVEGMNTLPLTEDLIAQYPALTVIAITREGHMDYIQQAMLAGARGFVTTPLADGQLSRVLHQIHRLELTRRAQLVPGQPSEAPQPTAPGKIVAVYSPKGGVGKSTLAGNLAVAIRERTHERVVLVDSNPQFGHLGLVLNVHTNYSFMDLFPRIDELDNELIEGMMATHSTGVHLLLAPLEIERADAIPPQALKKVLLHLKKMFAWVIVDTWSVLLESTLDVLDIADQILLLMTPDIVSLRDVKRFLELAESLGYPLKKFDVIVNRTIAGGLERAIIEEGLKRQVTLTIPEDDPLVTYTLNRGIPLVIGNRRSPVARAIFQLTDQITNHEQPIRTSQNLSSRLKQIFNVRKA